jgi:starch-binding outer membrane protein, SusD/RagB family
MNKSYISIFIAALLLYTVACSEDFLDEENKNSLTEDNFYQTREDFLLALNSLYTPLAHGGVFGLSFQFMFGSFEDRIIFETIAQDVISISASEGRVQQMWRDLYMGMYRTNVFVNKMNQKPVIEGLSGAERNIYLGQAKALRAAYMFYLVVIFNRPPFYDDLTIPVDFNKPLTNSEPEQFWDLIRQDLLWAKDHLPDSYSAQNVGRITAGAARAMLGKALLYKHYHFYVKNGLKGSPENIADLRLAKDIFLEVINSGNYELITPKAPKGRKDYINAFLCNFSHVDLPAGNNLYPSENNRESVWEIQYSDARDGNYSLPGWMVTGNMHGWWFGPHGSSFKNLEAHPDLWNAFETAGAPAGFDRDPRAYGTLYIDNDSLEFRSGKAYFGVRYRSGIHNKRIARSRGLIPTSGNPYPTNSFGLKKYFYPIYDEKVAPFNDPTNQRIIRFSDVLLMYAEVTYLLQENTADGLAKLNMVRGRVDMPARTELTNNIIIHERDVELALETHRWFDLIRWSFDPAWGIDMKNILSRQTSPAGTDDFFIPGKHEFLPIPIQEINLSQGQMVQNPGW